MKRKLMFIYAHPDDETFASGGTIARYALQSDCEIVLFCATRGEAGKTGNPPLCTQEELGEVRSRELKGAASLLGINRVILGNYGDGRLAEAPFQQLVDEITRQIRLESPQAVVTFPPHGISGHPDHQVIQRATFEALSRLDAELRIHLYYIVIPESDSTPGVHTTPLTEVTHRIDVAPFRREIMGALRQHRTQHLSIQRVFPGVWEGNWKNLRTTEYYQIVNAPAGITGTELI
ncbi:hypothetical protein GCM10007416_09900 [Kroppenstedtia guangzhouensis]|uniref:N-acetylglucosaminyl deacetylase, LmbE family n=1 Tax=Kroppenstedtia guangzhouensis TaxID=1274356 RepID=A0ABQ1G8R2_9BACL|nr:PIG-L family deacetylase [Kroppenstedtia guangzhouensis]GGA38958.1 hypothetical protein GCM10007416_09900 [Kroppenstedtia guangzhouensis]